MLHHRVVLHTLRELESMPAHSLEFEGSTRPRSPRPAPADANTEQRARGPSDADARVSAASAAGTAAPTTQLGNHMPACPHPRASAESRSLALALSQGPPAAAGSVAPSKLRRTRRPGTSGSTTGPMCSLCVPQPRPRSPARVRYRWRESTRAARRPTAHGCGGHLRRPTASSARGTSAAQPTCHVSVRLVCALPSRNLSRPPPHDQRTLSERLALCALRHAPLVRAWARPQLPKPLALPLSCLH